MFLDAGLPRFTPPFDGQTDRHERYRAAARAALQDPSLAPKIAARAHATWIAGGSALWAGTYDRAYALLEEGVALEDLLGNQEDKAIALMRAELRLQQPQRLRPRRVAEATRAAGYSASQGICGASPGRSTRAAGC